MRSNSSRSKPGGCTGIYEGIISLNDAGLYASAVKLAEVAYGLQVVGHPYFTEAQLCHAYLITGEYYYSQKEYHRAEHYYGKVLEAREGWSVGGTIRLSVTAAAAGGDPASEIVMGMSLGDLKHKQALCMSAAGNEGGAIELLNTIPVRERSAKVNMFMGDLNRRRGSQRSAIANYRAVLEECSYALDAAEHLVELGLDLKDMEALVKPAQWLTPWVKSYFHLRAGNCHGAIQVLDESPIFAELPQALAMKGKAYYLVGDYKMAAFNLEKCHRQMPGLLTNMDILAFIYTHHRLGKEDACERLAEKVRNVSPGHVVTYVCMACNALIKKRGSLALALAHKAVQVDHGKSEAQLLLGTVLFNAKRYEEALAVLRRHVHMDRNSFEAHEAVIETCLKMRNCDEAYATLRLACAVFGPSERMLTMEARVIRAVAAYEAEKEAAAAAASSQNENGGASGSGERGGPSSSSGGSSRSGGVGIPIPVMKKARALLEKAVSKNPSYTPAVFALVDIYRSFDMFDEALAILKAASVRVSMGKIHRLMGDLYLNCKGDEQRALDAYAIALNIDSEDEGALQGVQNIEGRPRCSPSVRISALSLGGGPSGSDGSGSGDRMDEDGSVAEEEEDDDPEGGSRDSAREEDEELAAQWAEMDLELSADEMS